MATADSAALDDFLNAFTSQVDSGFGLISGDVSAVFGTLIIISVGLSAILWAVDESQTVTAAFIRKILFVGFFAWLIGSWHTLSTTIVNGFASLGLKAGAGSLSLGDFMSSPTKIIGLGFTDAFALVAYIGQLSQQGMGFGFFNHFDVILVAAVAAIGIIIAFIILGVELAITIIEFHIVTLIAFVTVPFGVLAQTAFMSERAIGYVVSVGVKLMALALVVSIGEMVFQTYTVSAQPTAPEECGLLLASVLMLMLALKIPSIAGSLISGGPQLSAGSAVAGAAGVAAAVGGVMLAGRAAGALVSRGVTEGLASGAGKVAAADAAAGAIPTGRGADGGARSPTTPADSTGPSAGSADGGGSGGASGAGPQPAPTTADVLASAVRRAPLQAAIAAATRSLGGPASPPDRGTEETGSSPAAAASSGASLAAVLKTRSIAGGAARTAAEAALVANEAEGGASSGPRLHAAADHETAAPPSPEGPPSL